MHLISNLLCLKTQAWLKTLLKRIHVRKVQSYCYNKKIDLVQDEYEEMFERIDREADGEVYVREVLDFLRSMASDLDQVRNIIKVLQT